MQSESSRILWRIYAAVYDVNLNRFTPYQKLIESLLLNLEPSDGKKILDAGCGTGNFLWHLLQLKPETQVVGIDYSNSMLDKAASKLQSFKNAELRIHDLNQPLPFASQSFDAVVCNNVLYAVNKPYFLLKELFRVLKEEGELVLVTPITQPKMSRIFMEHVADLRSEKPNWWFLKLGAQLTVLAPAVISAVVINRFIQQQPSFHFLSEEELGELALATGFTLEKLEKVYGNQCLLFKGIKTYQKSAPGHVVEGWSGLA